MVRCLGATLLVVAALTLSYEVGAGATASDLTSEQQMLMRNFSARGEFRTCPA